MAEELATLLALVEAGIDFTDQEDVVPISPASLVARLDALASSAHEIIGASTGREHNQHVPMVVLAGAPNAGKSTLFNAILGRKRAVASPIAGTTRDALREELDLRSGVGVVQLVDLAGVMEVSHDVAGIDEQAQSAAREHIDRADVVVHCDPSARFIEQFHTRGTVLRVRTKSDVPVCRTTAAAMRESPMTVLSVCALDGRNLDVLREAIIDALSAARGRSEHVVLPRHRRALGVACAHLDMARQAIVDPDAPSLRSPEIIAGELRRALDAMEELAGRMPPDEVIGRIFATFCIGK
jgi:tRNA modification GTPase